MRRRLQILIVTTLLSLVANSVSGTEKEQPPEKEKEKQKVEGFTMIHPDAKDVETFFQSRRIKVGVLYFVEDEELKLHVKTDFGWELQVGYPRNNYSPDYSYLEPVRVLGADRELEFFRNLKGEIILSEHATREGHWEVAGYVSERPAEKGANWFAAHKWDLFTTGKLRYRKALPEAVAGLEDPDPRVRQRSAAALGAIGEDGRKAIPRLTELVGDADEWVANTAAQAIGSLGGPEAGNSVPTLMDAIDRDSVGQWAIESLGLLGNGANESVPALIAALSSDDQIVEWKSIEALGRIAPEDPRVKKALAPYLDHESDFLQKEVREALGMESDQAGS